MRAVANRDPDYYDMYADPNEGCFAQLYLERIRRHAAAAAIRPGATVLDAGCQAGRLAVPLAREGFRVTGVDTSGFGLRRAKAHADQAGVEVDWVRGDLLDVLPRWDGRQFDLVVCAEVIYLVRRYRELLTALAGATRAGGLVAVSHRPRFYYLHEALKLQDFETAMHVLRDQEGRFRDSEYYNWQTEPQLRALYAQAGLEWVAHYAIDRYAWLEGFSPSSLPEEAQRRWMELELGDADSDRMNGRYVLVVARRPGTGP